MCEFGNTIVFAVRTDFCQFSLAHRSSPASTSQAQNRLQGEVYFVKQKLLGSRFLICLVDFSGFEPKQIHSRLNDKAKLNALLARVAIPAWYESVEHRALSSLWKFTSPYVLDYIHPLVPLFKSPNIVK